MKEIRTYNPQTEATALLDMDEKQASVQFQQYTQEEQLAIIQTVSDPKDREQLYYLVPDCTELVQQSPTEAVMQTALVHLGTGQATGILSAASSEQLAEIIDLVAYQNETLDETRLEAWFLEMVECGEEVFERAVCSVDAHLLGEFFKSRLKLELGARFSDDAIPYTGWVVEQALMSPEDLSYDSDDTDLLVEMIYAVDGELFQGLMEYIFLQDGKALDGWDGFKRRETQESVSTRIEERDQEKKSVTEADLEQLVDLDNLQLEE